MIEQTWSLLLAALCLIRPYILHPLLGLQVYLPNSYLISWLSDKNAFSPKRDIPDLSGKVILVTGGSSGIGLESVQQILKHNPAKIFVGARSREKVNTFVQALKEEKSDVADVVTHVQMDLADYQSTRQAAQMILSSTRRLDVLLLNAGALISPYSVNSDGHDLTLATNHLGHFLLVHLLLPLLSQTVRQQPDPDVRIVVIASEGHNLAPKHFMDHVEDSSRLSRLNDLQRYGVSKACNILFAQELAKRLKAEGVIAVSLHPGLVSTQLYDNSTSQSFWLRAALPTMMRFVFDDVHHGALCQLYLGFVCPRTRLTSGAYYTPIGRLLNIPLTEDRALASRLWRSSEIMMREYL